MSLEARIKRLEKMSGIESGATDYPLIPVLVESSEELDLLATESLTDPIEVPEKFLDDRTFLSVSEVLELRKAMRDGNADLETGAG